MESPTPGAATRIRKVSTYESLRVPILILYLHDWVEKEQQSQRDNRGY